MQASRPPAEAPIPTTGNGGLEVAPEDFAATFSRPFARDAGVFVGPFSFFVTWSSAAKSFPAASAVCQQAAEPGPASAKVGQRPVSALPHEQRHNLAILKH